jgi:large subunit ribosomal protein L10
VLKDFSKSHDRFQIKLIALGGKLLAPSDLDRLVNLPNREQAIAMLMGTMKAPIQQFVRTLAEPHAKLARTLAAIRDQKQQAA